MLSMASASHSKSLPTVTHLLDEFEVHEPQVYAGALHQAATKQYSDMLNIARGHLSLNIARPDANLEGAQQGQGQASAQLVSFQQELPNILIVSRCYALAPTDIELLA